MSSGLPGLYVAGELVGGANGANRLSGNAITEALVFGRQAGRSAAAYAKTMRVAPRHDGREAVDLIEHNGPKVAPNTAAMVQRLQAVMSDDVGPLRTGDGIDRARNAIAEMQQELGERPFGSNGRFDPVRLDWFDLRNMLTTAGIVVQAARQRTESRGAHQREDFPGLLPEWTVNQAVRLNEGRIDIARMPIATQVAAQ
jgi:succinate dehydrogenase/fumarate reductase flavoprotein subunit